MTRVLCLLLAVLPGLVWGAGDIEGELRRVEFALQRVQQEQQSVFQQFQMTQELRRTELQMANPTVIQNSPVYAEGNPPPNYDDVVRERQQRDDRIRQYTEQLNRLYARYQDLEQEKAMLLEREAELQEQR